MNVRTALFGVAIATASLASFAGIKSAQAVPVADQVRQVSKMENAVGPKLPTRNGITILITVTKNRLLH